MRTFLLTLVLVLMADSGWAEPNPINGARIVFFGIDGRPLIGVPIGYHHDGLLNGAVSTHYWNNQLQLFTENGFKETFSSMFRSMGAEVEVPSQYFSAYQDYSGNQFILVGKLLSVSYNTYGALSTRSLTGRNKKPKLTMTVSWELFDGILRKVVYQKLITSSVSVGTNESVPVDMFNQLVSDDSFKSNLQRAREAVADAIASGAETATVSPPLPQGLKWKKPLPNENDIIYIPSGPPKKRKPTLEDIKNSTVLIKTEHGSGTAFVIADNGYAISNHHVVSDARRITAVFADGNNASVRVVRSDSHTDVALLEIFCELPCPVSPWALDTPELGDDVYVLGNPLGEEFAFSVSKGVMSGVRRNNGMMLMQTDAAINGGNSGGPFIRASDSHVTGIVSAKLVARGVEGMGFAISLADAFRVLGIQAQSPSQKKRSPTKP